MQKIFNIFLHIIPILVMIGLIPFIQNDYVLAAAYTIIIIFCSFFIKIQKNDIIFFLFGFVAVTFSEYLFISTEVEVFLRNSLFGIMPLWLPFLWGYVFIVMKRSIEILDK